MTRLRLAQLAAAVLPPAGALLVTQRLYPWALALQRPMEIRRRSITGSFVYVNVADEIGYRFARHGYYEWRVLAVALVVCKPGDIVVEIGANIGTETAGLADIVGPSGHVYAFEPLPANVDRLHSNVGANVTVIQAAVSDGIGTADFVLPDQHNSGVGRVVRNGKQPNAVPVRVITLDDHFGIGAPARLMMMDVEGAEPDVLRGGARWIGRHRPVIFLEAHQAHHHRRLLLELLTGYGYTVYSLSRWGLTEPKSEPDPYQWNWLALHADDAGCARPIGRMLLLCGLLPPPLNPLATSRWKKDR